MTTKEFVGEEFEQAYARAFNGTIVGGHNDHGHDVLVPGFGPVQVKASVTGAKSFLAESLRRHRFIPICIGEPGAKEEMIDHLKRFGAWVGKDVSDRSRIEVSVLTVRTMLS